MFPLGTYVSPVKRENKQNIRTVDNFVTESKHINSKKTKKKIKVKKNKSLTLKNN